MVDTDVKAWLDMNRREIPRKERWTAADLDRMPEDGLRYEVLNGQLVISAVPTPRHQWLIGSLGRALDAVLPPNRLVLAGVGVLIGDDEPIPDLMVMTDSIDLDARGIPARQVELVVEVLSSSTTLQDRIVKPALYAAAGIPNYWRLEPHPFEDQLSGESVPVLFAHELGAERTYELTHRVPANNAVTLRSPFEFTIDPGSLLP
ncbi:Uma2 family endonuclease [Nocardia amamiensis]|uniref:Uma2 family endonuclease n=1 Tax=Nocardia amamiensis TaxID=404578 RepID=UPI000AA9EADF|nr:Uma2 family endonuclease [Nocardia amamiensis]